VAPHGRRRPIGLRPGGSARRLRRTANLGSTARADRCGPVAQALAPAAGLRCTSDGPRSIRRGDPSLRPIAAERTRFDRSRSRVARSRNPPALVARARQPKPGDVIPAVAVTRRELFLGRARDGLLTEPQAAAGAQIPDCISPARWQDSNTVLVTSRVVPTCRPGICRVPPRSGGVVRTNDRVHSRKRQRDSSSHY
jgi:hypothetical protein